MKIRNMKQVTEREKGLKGRKLFRRNQIIITTLAVMIAAAGYLNYAGKRDLEAGSRLSQAGSLELSEEDLMAENLAAQAQLLVEMERRQARLEARVETALVALARPQADTWVEDMKGAIREYCRLTGLADAAGRGRLYAALEREARCDTDRRLSALRSRRKKAGEKRRDYMALTKLDAIGADRKLRAAFEGIVARETARAAAERRNE